jgi:hypothetical protein
MHLLNWSDVEFGGPFAFLYTAQERVGVAVALRLALALDEMDHALACRFLSFSNY